MTLFSIFGVLVRLDWTFIIVFPLLIWSLAQATMPTLVPELDAMTYVWMGVAAAAGFFLSIVLRETIYAAAMRAGGLRLRALTLTPLGGVPEVVPGIRPRPGPLAAAALAGVLTSVLIALVMALLFAGASGSGTPLGVLGVLLALLGLNGLLALAGLLPAYPLAAGQVLRAIVEKRTADAARAHRIATVVSVGIAVAALLGGAVLALAMSAVLGAWLGVAGLLLLAARASAPPLDKGDIS